MTTENTPLPGKARILVVDDLEDNVAVLQSFLTAQGYVTTGASSGPAALAEVERDPPDVVLLDLVMPQMDGLEVCRRLKGDPATRHIPVIMVSGVVEKKANVQAIEAGADDFIVKPFDAILLDARIRSSLRAKRLQDSLIDHQQALEKGIEERTAQLMRTQNVAVFSLAKLAESRDTETGEHLERMRSYAREIAVGLSKTAKYKEVVT